MKQKEHSKNKLKIVSLFVLPTVLFFIMTANFVCAAQGYSYTPMEKIPGFETAGTDFPNYILSITKFAIWVVGIAALLMIIIGGFMYITSAGNTSRTETAKTIIFDSLYGLLVALAAWLLLYVINPDLVRVNISLKPMSVAPAAVPAQTTATTQPAGQNCSYTTPTASTLVCQGASCSSASGCNISQYENSINSLAQQNGVSPQVVKAIICRESKGNAAAISDKHACGLMQVMPQGGYNCNNDPRQLMTTDGNITAGIQILKQKYANVSGYSYSTVTRDEMAFAAYNCCANGDNPNAPSRDCGNFVPKWACPISPGSGTYNMCSVKDYACDVSACIKTF